MALVALGVTGGIGAYKAVEVARGLQQQGHDVAAIMTRSARRFVGEVTFEAITRRRVITSQWARGANADIEHISLATDIRLLLVAPATASIIGRFAAGVADDFLSSLYLATRAPVLMAPAMNTNMLEHPAVRANLDTLGRRGVHFVEPGAGYLACGWIGKGRLAEPEDIVAAAARLLHTGRSLAGRVVVVSAGPTYEDIDDVRYIGNRSSGRMGYAVASEAERRGARVILVTGPTSLPPPAGVEVERVRSADEMHAAVMRHAQDADVVVMTAAVADYRPERRAPGKIEKTERPMELSLVRTPDILAELGRTRDSRRRPVLVGFAAESGDPVERGRQKLLRKGADLIVANDISIEGLGFESDRNAATLVSHDGLEVVPAGPKAALAGRILDRTEQLLAAAGLLTP
jgi:phosphopantothenoylcysteine decarboxylase / phosphopantothenate---cysteine ligase